MEVQLFGIRKDRDTRAALRFFSERRIRTHFVDLTVRAASPGELRRFVQKFGAQALIDRDGKHFTSRGLGAAIYGDEKWVQLLAEDPLLLKMPLVRFGSQLTVGAAEDTWKEWVAAK